MATYSPLVKFPGRQYILAAGSKVLELCKFLSGAGKYKKEKNGVIDYIEKSIEPGNTVLDIGSHEGDYIYFMRKQLRQSGKIIAFESVPASYRNLLHLKEILDWKNVELEFTRLSNRTATEVIDDRIPARNTSTIDGAVVINIKDNIRNSVSNKIITQTLDGYCLKHHIRPDFIKIDAGGNELKILQGAISTLKNYKPRMLVKCEERIAGKQNVLETFNILKQLNYTGYFVLDAMRIPLVNFDGNVYQNTCKDFYCTNFIFE